MAPRAAPLSRAVPSGRLPRGELRSRHLPTRPLPPPPAPLRSAPGLTRGPPGGRAEGEAAVRGAAGAADGSSLSATPRAAAFGPKFSQQPRRCRKGRSANAASVSTDGAGYRAASGMRAPCRAEPPPVRVQVSGHIHPWLSSGVINKTVKTRIEVVPK
ncbi:polycystic kidney disease and receptor for egg jelly-related protein-like [Lagopus muta]|uniref:polycystic kidney disease and receptor for egg jelly-related protein-like n=1 Tax=Lagopus muta TaxID=64668 RepID=UPI0020A071CF|nr:polycystic kidney disease and receptor for egg jelly-related protein-like [Lagopus muta]